MKTTLFSLILILVIALTAKAQLGEIPDAATWEQKVDSKYPTVHPHMDDNNDNDAFAWGVHYWLRAYGNMAVYTGNTKWIDWGFGIIDHMFSMTDRERWRRGELSIAAGDFDYDSAYLNLWQRHWCKDNSSDRNCSGIPYNVDSTLITISWRRPFNGNWRVETLNDGMIIHGIMRFIDAVLSDNRFSSYETQARAVIAQCVEIAELHVNNYSFTKNKNHALGPGGFYYTRTSDPFANWGNPADSRLYNDGLALNHSTTMSAAMLLIDKWDGPRPEYRRMADLTMAYFLRSVWIENDAFCWRYNPRKKSSSAIEDVAHGHVDLSLVTLLWREGSSLLNDSIMQKFANIVSNNLWAGNGDIYNYLDGTGTFNHSAVAITYDYIDFIPWDTTILDKAEQVLMKYANSVWSRPMLGWSNVLRWKKRLEEGTPLSISDEAVENISVYPNPVTDVLSFSTETDFILKNTNGQIVAKGKASKVDMASYSSGLYLLQLSKNNKVVKVIKN